MRRPNPDEQWAILAEQEATERRRFLESRRLGIPRQDEAAAELRAMGIEPPVMEGVPFKTAEVDVMREPLPPRAPGPPEPRQTPNAYLCGWCGKVFDKKTYKTKGAATVARNRHQKSCDMKAAETAGV